LWASAGEVYVQLPTNDVDGLGSAVRNGGFCAVFLFVYPHQIITNLPDGVRQRPATEYLSWEDAQTMHHRGVPVALISDVVRFLAAAQEGGVVIATDLWWIRPAPPSPFVATLHEKEDRGGLVNCPCGVLPYPHRFANALGQLMCGFKDKYTSESACVHCPAAERNALMHGLCDVALKLGMGPMARPPIEFDAAICKATCYDLSRVLNGTRVPNKLEVLTYAVALQTSFASNSLLATIRPYACGSADIAVGHCKRVLEGILAGGVVHESAKWYYVWQQLVANASHLTVKASSLVEGQPGKPREFGLYWDPESSWEADRPLCVYGGFCVYGSTSLLEPRQRDYLMHMRGERAQYVCGAPWDNMPVTHVGGRLNDPKNVPGSRASTKIKWIRLENLLPQDVAKSMKGVREACVSMELPVVYSGRRNPSQDGCELFLSYGSDPGNACSGLTAATLTL
jgi:hypothetical protein